MEPKIFTSEELKQFNGKAGKPAYVAFKDKVYDVSDSDLFVDGDHEGMHYAGRDLTDGMLDAPHGDEVFENFPVVGEFRKS